MAGLATNASTACWRIGRPPSVTSCLGWDAPNRAPRPPAAMIAATNKGSGDLGRLCHNPRMTFGRRIAGVLQLDPSTFEEIESNTAVTGQAFVVVVIASVAAGFGAGIHEGPIVLVREAFAALVGWVMW